MAEDPSNNYLTQHDPSSAYAQVIEAHRILNQEVDALNSKF